MVAVVALLAETRSFRHVAIELWWAGRWVRRTTLREALLQPLEPLRRKVEALTEQTGGDPLDLAEAIADEAEREAPDHGGWGALGARLGPRPEDRRRVTVAMALLMQGQDVAWDVHDDGGASTRALFELATGLRGAAEDDLGDGPWLPEMPDVETDLAELTGGLSLAPRDMSQAISEATDQELDEARDVAQRGHDNEPTPLLVKGAVR